jgi:hypothetical protein
MEQQDSLYWRRRAHQVRLVASNVDLPEAKHTMLRIAEGYDRLARATEKLDPRSAATGETSRNHETSADTLAARR